MTPETQNNRIEPVLSQEYQRSWHILRQAIGSISDEYWITTAKEWSFSWTVYHIIETADFYSQNTPENMEWGKNAGINWETDTDEIINQKKSQITKKHLLKYLETIENRVIKLFEDINDDGLFGTDGFNGGTLVILEKLLYLLRHNMFHIGELNKVLRDSNCQRISWQ